MARRPRRDRYPGLCRDAEVVVLKDLDDCVARVRERYPGAACEGSTGPERTFELRVDGLRPLVAHCYLGPRGWRLRIAGDKNSWLY